MDQTNIAPGELYAYASLPSSTSIRLLRRLGVGEDGLFEFHLETVDLAAGPKAPPYGRSKGSGEGFPHYHCLSYTWGNPRADGTGFHEAFEAHAPEYRPSQLMDVRCDGKRFKIGRNLYDYFCEVPTDGWVHCLRDQPRKDTQQTLLHESAASGDSAVVHLFVGQGANVHAKDVDGRTPLHCAAANGQVESVKILIKGGADISARDNEGNTPGALALENNHLELVEVMRRCIESVPDAVIDDVPDFDLYGPDDYIWIDAICVDQSNLQERATHVTMMNRVYSNATYVLVWLGKKDEYTDAALSTISKLASSAEKFAESKIFPYRTMSQEEYEAASVPYISRGDWDALASFFLRQWFRRIWVVQEVVFSQAIIMYYGSQMINWNDIEVVLDALRRRDRSLFYEASRIYIPLNEVATSVEYYFGIMQRLLDARIELEESPDEKPGEVFTLTNLVGEIFPFRATDPRDKIFAVLPMSTLNPRRKISMLPDYCLSVEECYAAFTKILMAEQRSVEALSYNQDETLKKIASLPSWVPDFSTHGTNPINSRNFLAAGDLAFRSSPEGMQWNEILLRGKKFDVITRTGNPRPLEGPNQKLELDDSWLDLVLEMEKDGRYQSTGQALTEVLWRTLCADRDANGDSPAPPVYGEMFKFFISAMVCAEPERQARRAENQTGDVVTRFTVVKERNVTGTGDPAMTRAREELPQVDRSLDSPFMDCVRPTLSKLKQLANGSEESCIPTVEEVERYFQHAITPLRDPSGLVVIPPLIAPYVTTHAQAYGRRRLFATKEGCLGLGPASLAVGDHVWIAPGSKTPLVLRPRDSATTAAELPSDRIPRFRFVGEAYVHGIMRGEAAAHLEQNDLEEIVLV